MSEIHFLMARNSELVFTLDGRHLSSAINPTREAHQWVSHHQSQWKDRESVIVLGLGCGYHVRALKAATAAQVLVLEPDLGVIKSALRVHPFDLQESQIFRLEDASSLRRHPALQEATKRSYCVLTHEPSAFLYRELFGTAKQFLLGRQREGLIWLFKNRGFQLPADFDIAANSDVSLKTLDSLWTQQLEGRADLVPLMQALRELIL